MGLRPDLIVVWLHGSGLRQLDKLLHLGIPVFYSEPRRLEDIARAIEQLGRLAGTEPVANREAQSFRARLAALRMRYAARAPIRVFYQVWQKPLLTINGKHIISDVIDLCGGQNVFGGLDLLVPEVSIEAVLAADPEVIATAEVVATAEDGLEVWRRWPHLAATERQNLFRIPEDLISRHTPRILDGAQMMCEDLDVARAKRR